MKEKTILRLFSLAVFMTLLWSCRSEDLLTETKVASPSKFRVFTSVNGEKIHYAEGFKILMEKYDSLNNEQHTVKAMKNAFENSKNISEEYIEFNIRSEDFISDSGERWVVYPIIKNSSVSGLIAGVLNKEETTVEFRELMAGNQYYDNALPLFRVQYQKSLALAGQSSRSGKCGLLGQPPCEIDVIVITPTNPKGGGGPWIGGSGGEVPPKECSKFNNCINPDGGGGGSEDPGPDLLNPNPCSKLKAQSLNAGYKAKIAELDKSSVLSQKKETGYSENKNGVFTALTPSASTDNSDGMRVIVSANTKGYIHTHQNDYEDGTYDDDGNPQIRQPIRMFSPADVNTLMTMAGYVTDGNYKDLYATMVSSYGNYTIKFTGAASDIKTGFDSEQWRIDYKNYRKENPYWSFEKLFLTFLKDKMNVKGVELYKIKSNGIIQKKTLNSNNKVESNDCPQ